MEVGQVIDLGVEGVDWFDVQPAQKNPNRAKVPLVQAARKGKRKEVAQLIEAGADVHAVEDDGFLLGMPIATPMSAAIENGRCEVVEILLQAGVGLEQRVRPAARSASNQLPLALASDRGEAKVVAVLLATGANVNAKSGTEKRPNLEHTALHRAAEEGHATVVAKLVEAGADVNIQSDGPDGRRTPLHCALFVVGPQEFRRSRRSPAKVGKVVALLLAGGANVNMVDGSGVTPLYRAVESGYEKAVSLLVEAGAACDSTDAAGLTLLHRAAEEGYPKIIVQLLEAGLSVDSVEPQEQLLYCERGGGAVLVWLWAPA